MEWTIHSFIGSPGPHFIQTFSDVMWKFSFSFFFVCFISFYFIFPISFHFFCQTHTHTHTLVLYSIHIFHSRLFGHHFGQFLMHTLTHMASNHTLSKHNELGVERNWKFWFRFDRTQREIRIWNKGDWCFWMKNSLSLYTLESLFQNEKKKFYSILLPNFF